MQLLTAQQAANVQLQLQAHQNQAVQIVHMDALRSLAESTQQRNLDHIFVSILTYDGTNKEVFFKWVERWEAASLLSRSNIHTEALGTAGGDVRTCFMGLPMNLLWSSVQQECKRCFSNLPMAAHAAVSLNTITQKSNESLHMYVSRYRRLHYAATNKTACENTNPMNIYHFVSIINNTNIADKIAKQVLYTLKILQDAFERALTLKAGLQLAKSVHLGTSPQVRQVSTGVSHHPDKLKGCVHQVNVKYSQARSNACWKCGELCHFQKDCKPTLNFQGGDRDDPTFSDTNPTIGKCIISWLPLCQ